MRFECATCGHRFEMSGIAIGIRLWDGETVVPLGQAGEWEAPCPVCHQRVTAENQVNAVVDGLTFTGFADTPEEFAVLGTLLGKLRELDENATLDDIADAIEEKGPQARPFAEWVRRNKDLITVAIAASGLTLTAAGVVIALLTFFVGPFHEQQDPPPPPLGITEEQFERLISELRDAASAAQPSESATEVGQAETGESKSEQTGTGHRGKRRQRRG
jgi:hypothetical protein